MDIALPRSRVIELFDTPGNMKEWQPELLSYDHMSGESGQVGAKTKMVYQMGNREIEMVETVTRRNLPDEFVGTYEADGVWNEIANTFVESSPDSTQWILTSEFVCSGFFMKMLAAVAPGSFKKQTRTFMDRFVAFAEGRGSTSTESAATE